jgi:hypothetical protein
LGPAPGGPHLSTLLPAPLSSAKSSLNINQSSAQTASASLRAITGTEGPGWRRRVQTSRDQLLKSPRCVGRGAAAHLRSGTPTPKGAPSAPRTPSSSLLALPLPTISSIPSTHLQARPRCAHSRPRSPHPPAAAVAPSLGPPPLSSSRSRQAGPSPGRSSLAGPNPGPDPAHPAPPRLPQLGRRSPKSPVCEGDSGRARVRQRL